VERRERALTTLISCFRSDLRQDAIPVPPFALLFPDERPRRFGALAHGFHLVEESRQGDVGLRPPGIECGKSAHCHCQSGEPLEERPRPAVPRGDGKEIPDQGGVV
jgi:hypothetical protein